MPAPPPSLTLYPSRWKTLGLVLLGALLTAGGFWMGASGEGIGYLIAAFFALCTLVMLIVMIPGSAFLHIDESGFTFCSLFRKHSLAWSDIDEFYVVVMSQHGLKVHEMVGFDFAPGYDRSRAGRAVAKFLTRCEGGLPDTYGKKASDLVDLLNARLHHSRSAAS